MRKILIGVLIIILVACAGLLLFKGIKVGNLEILSILGLSENSKKLDTSISELKQMKEVEFEQSNKNIEISTEQFNSQREQYAALIGTSTELELNSAIQTEKYEVEYLWVKLGNHATKNGITLKMDIAKGASSQNQKYNLQFTATGDYVNVTDFIYEIENDSTLGFKIENFKLLPTGGTSNETEEKNEEKKDNTTENNTTSNTTTSVDTNKLVATFTVKDVYIDLEQLTSSNNKTNTTGTNSNTNTTNNSTTNTSEQNNDENLDEIANSIQ